MVYMGHRRFLHKYHPYCQNKKSFDRTREDRSAPEICDGRQIFKVLSKLNVVFGKGAGSVPAPAGSLWKKKSLLSRLPYWQFMIVCHTLDGMHLTKKMCESTLGILMAIRGKVKTHLKLDRTRKI
jgi:hypothetical protein